MCPHCGFMLPMENKADIAQNEMQAEDKVSAGFVVLSLLIPLVGIILGVVNWKKTPKAAKTYLFAGLAMWVISMIISMSMSAL